MNATFQTTFTSGQPNTFASLPVPPPTPTPAIKSLDLEQLVQRVLKDIQSDIDFVYPHGEMSNSRCHGGFLSVQGRVRSLLSVLDCIKE